MDQQTFEYLFGCIVNSDDEDTKSIKIDKLCKLESLMLRTNKLTSKLNSRIKLLRISQESNEINVQIKKNKHDIKTLRKEIES